MKKHFWFQIHYGKYSEVVIYTGSDLASVAARIDAAQRGRLAYNPRSPRITRIAAINPPQTDPQFKAFLDQCLRMESNSGTER